MTQYYVLEIQQYASGEFGHIVHYAFDADPAKARLKAESKYHEILAAAAVSELPSHAATLIATNGKEVMHQCYLHAIEPSEPEPSEEPEPEPSDEPEEPTE